MSNLKLLTVKELAQETGISVHSIYRLVESRSIPFIRLNSNSDRSRVYFRREDILQWLESKREETVPLPKIMESRDG